MISTQYINLNMVPSGVMPVLHCSQYDVGRPLGVVIYNGSESVDLSGYTVTIEGTRTDRTPVTAGVTTDGNIGVFTTTPTMTNENDTYRAKVVLTDNAGRVSSLAFVMCVDEKTMDENAEEIEEDASLYQQYTGTVQTIIAQIRGDLAAEITARQNAISAEASARQAADNTLQSNINAEASTRATQDASLQSQINQLIAPSGSAPSAAEVENARIGSDGTVYPTLGDAIRTQNSLLKSQIDDNVRQLWNGSPDLNGQAWQDGSAYVSSGNISITTALKYRIVNSVPYKPLVSFKLKSKTGFQFNVFKQVNGAWSDEASNVTSYDVVAGTPLTIVLRRATENTSEIANVTTFLSNFETEQILAKQADVDDLATRLDAEISVINTELNADHESLVKSNVINSEALRTENLFDKDTARFGSYNNSGVFVPGRSTYQSTVFDIYTSDFIPCASGESFRTNCSLNGRKACFFDEDKTFISYSAIYGYDIEVPNNNSIKYFTIEFFYYTTDAVAYRFCYKPDSFMVVKGSTVPEKYEPYYKRIVDELTCSHYEPKGILFDTDWAYDVDDIAAVRVLLWAERVGLVDIVATAISHYVPEAAGSFEAFCNYEGRHGLPIGIDKTVQWSAGQTGVWHENMLLHPHTITSETAEDAVNTYRRALAYSRKPIDIIVTGPLINVYNLMLSSADDISDLDGTELLNNKCNRIWVMGGQYPSGSEANFTSEFRGRTKTQYVVSKCTVPITFLGYEAGLVRIGTPLIGRQDYDPLVQALIDAGRISPTVEGGPDESQMLAWDIFLTWIACFGNPEECGFTVYKGTNTVSSDGSNVFTLDGVGHHEYVSRNHPNAWYQNEINTILERVAWPTRKLGEQQIKRVVLPSS